MFTRAYNYFKDIKYIICKVVKHMFYEYCKDKKEDSQCNCIKVVHKTSSDSQNLPKFKCYKCGVPMVYVKDERCENMGLYAFDANCNCYESKDIAVPKSEVDEKAE